MVSCEKHSSNTQKGKVLIFFLLNMHAILSTTNTHFLINAILKIGILTIPRASSFSHGR